MQPLPLRNQEVKVLVLAVDGEKGIKPLILKSNRTNTSLTQQQ